MAEASVGRGPEPPGCPGHGARGVTVPGSASPTLCRQPSTAAGAWPRLTASFTIYGSWASVWPSQASQTPHWAGGVGAGSGVSCSHRAVFRADPNSSGRVLDGTSLFLLWNMLGWATTQAILLPQTWGRGQGGWPQSLLAPLLWTLTSTGTVSSVGSL